LWNTLVLDPMLNSLIVLYSVLFSSFGLAIVALTIIVRLATYPLTLRQLRSTKALQTLQPKLQEIQKKYAKNKTRLQREMMELYKEAGVNPAGCLWPMLVQIPIWIALYQSIMRALAATPESLLSLSQHLYSWSIVNQVVPLKEKFLWLDLSKPDGTIILAVLVGVTMWVQQKMVTAPAADPRQESMNRMMLLMMPFMFGLFALQFPSGLALFWLVSNIIGIVMQYFMGGWGYLFGPPAVKVAPKERKKGAKGRVIGKSSITSEPKKSTTKKKS